jgi:hypothetical protein
MNNPRFGRLLLALAGFLSLALANGAGAEPPSRAARLGYITGTVSFSPAGEDDWLRARVNRPLTNGDRLWVDDNARAELQIGGAAIRLGGGTSLTLLNVDDRIVQLQLTEGTLNVRVRSMGRNQAFEVNTPNLAFSITRAGQYRISVDANDDATAVLVRSGRGEAYGERRSYALNAGQGFRFYGTGLSDYDRFAARDDDLDRWALERDRRYEKSASARYVSIDVVGYEDLDAHGTWRKDPTYGNVWAPNRVASGWTPYRDGHWAWIEPWGWTWVDDQPWGYAVSHYGRWANVRGAWVWVPGPRTVPAVYAPAQVAFVGGSGSATAAVGALAALVGWFPLAPREVYQPSYPVSRGYFERINRSNAAVAPTVINNYYNTTIVNSTTVNRAPRSRQTYANQQVQGAVVAVPPQAFTRAQPVAQAAVLVPQQTAASAPAAPAPAPAVKPERQSVQGGAQAAEGKSRGRDRDRRVVARTAPPAPAKPAPAAAAPQPAVVTTVQAPAPTAPPPAVAPAAKSPDERRADSAKREGRGDGRKGDRDNAKADAGKGDAAKADAGKADAAKAEAAKAEAAKADAAKADAAKSAAAKADASKAEAAKAEAARQDAAKAEAAKAEAAKAEAAKSAERQRDRDKADAARGEERRRDRDKADAAKADAARAEAAAKGEAARAEAAKADAARAEAAKADAAKAAAAKAEAAKGEAAKAEAVRATQAKAAADKAAAAKAAADKAAADKAAADKAAAAKAAADKAVADKAAADKAAAAKAAAKADAKAERQEVRAARAEARKADDDKKGAN